MYELCCFRSPDAVGLHHFGPYNGVMHSLYQRLRELDWDTFQRLIGQLLAARFPNKTIRPVDGPGGDGGLDVYEGVLDGRPTIWQCKQFPNGLGTRQRAKVKESLNTAL